MSETPASMLKTRIDTMTREAAELRATTREAHEALTDAMTRYAAGVVGLPVVEAARDAHRSALAAEQSHGAALEIIAAELAVLDGKNLEAALVAELNAAHEKLLLVEGGAARRLEAAEREYRAAHYAAQDARQAARSIRDAAQHSGFKLLALIGEGVDTARRVPTPAEREAMLTALEPWKVRHEQALQLPDPLAHLPSDPAGSDGDHARRWRDLLP